ncbi:MAG: hypothetical protein K8S56_10000 [Candidatus Cloacimonetes bacterium]|nr:hypothetical protein [Candidatus Cloacimonadota bacterium]
MKKTLFLVIIAVLGLTCWAQDSIDEALESLSKDAATAYVNPIVSAFGADLNGGWYTHAPKGKIWGIDVGLKFVFMGSFFPDDAKDFSKSGQFRFTREQATTIVDATPSLDNISQTHKDLLIEQIMETPFTTTIAGPTIIGSSADSVSVSSDTETITIIEPLTQSSHDYNVDPYTIMLPVTGILEDFPILPSFAPQLTLGTLYGTNLVFRYVPAIEINEELGEFSYFGWGIQHNPKVWVNKLTQFVIPVDISISMFSQKMELGNYIEATAFMVGANVSKTIGGAFLNITPYGGLSLESSKMKFAYQVELDPLSLIDTQPIDISFEIEGENSARLTVGLNLHLGVFDFNADFNMAKYNSFTTGFGMGFTF